MKLTKDEQAIVEKNHNLIYGVANKFNLNIEEWYGLLAIELCKTVEKHNPAKSKLSTYYYIRVKGLISKEQSKRKAAKRDFESIKLNENYCGDGNNLSDLEMETELKIWLESQNNEILNLKYQGYNQNEIADILGISQSNVSRMLRKLRLDFEEYIRASKM